MHAFQKGDVAMYVGKPYFDMPREPVIVMITDLPTGDDATRFLQFRMLFCDGDFNRTGYYAHAYELQFMCHPDAE